jgi:hypothetical protein
MNIRIAWIVIGLVAASAPGLAQQSKPSKPVAAAVGTHSPPEKKPAAAKPQVAATSAAAPATDDHAAVAPGRKGKAAAKDAHLSPLPAGPVTVPNPQAVGWSVIDDTATGARLGLPQKIVPLASSTRTGSRWTSPHGQIQVETFRLHEAALPALFDEEKKIQHRAVEHGELKPDSFVISGMQGLKEFIVHVEASGTELRGITILYDQATEGTITPIALAMSNSFLGFPDPNAGPPPGKRRSVEYATAIVVSSRGDLLTIKQVTDDCQAITIPGLGHAERIATDGAADLALLRVYGARNLTAAALAGDDGKTDDIVLVGVADPLAQAGEGAVSSAPSHVTAQGVEPAPKLGFSGAAAIDRQGRFAGMAELNSPVLAGGNSTAPQATLIPAAAVRAFLGAQQIALAAGHAAMDQSVVRVICVRR